MNLPLDRTEWPRKWRELFEDRVKVIENEARFPKETAEFYAEQEIREKARLAA
jgi:hypothetical protein